MKNVLKMMRFDYSITKGIGGKYAFYFAIIFTVMCLIGFFPAALGFVVTPFALYAPLETVRKGDFMKIYGLLPMERRYVTKALFAEIAYPQIIGGIACELLLLVTGAIGKAHLYPAFLQEKLYDDNTQQLISTLGMKYSDLFVLAALATALITIIVLFFYMILEIKGETVALDKTTGRMVKELSTGDSKAWVTGAAVYDDMTLTEIARALSRRYAVNIRIATPALGQERYSLSLYNSEDIEDVLKALARVAPIKVVRQGKDITLRYVPARH